VAGGVDEIEQGIAAERRSEGLVRRLLAIVSPVVRAPLLGLSHSKFSVLVVADKFTVKVLPLGVYTGYSAAQFPYCRSVMILSIRLVSCYTTSPIALWIVARLSKSYGYRA